MTNSRHSDWQRRLIRYAELAEGTEQIYGYNDCVTLSLGAAARMLHKFTYPIDVCWTNQREAYKLWSLDFVENCFKTMHAVTLPSVYHLSTGDFIVSSKIFISPVVNDRMFCVMNNKFKLIPLNAVVSQQQTSRNHEQLLAYRI